MWNELNVTPSQSVCSRLNAMLELGYLSFDNELKVTPSGIAYMMKQHAEYVKFFPQMKDDKGNWAINPDMIESAKKYGLTVRDMAKHFGEQNVLFILGDE